MDAIDIKLLNLLQHNADLTVKELAEKVYLSVTPCWKRIQKLTADGVIRARVALLDAQKIRANVIVIVAIRTNQHNARWIEQFAAEVQRMPEVLEAYRMSGEVDYLLRVAVASIEEYDRFYKRLSSRLELADVTSSFAMEQIKCTTALPINVEPK
ncbi:MAG TPA: Lrp/AsnC family transcriptional regulator [Gammaproteobacteria bacterium]|nr:Lrp/AsnC family transcriptional regulator [Gammaproteobacteria bacterium]